MLKVILLMLFSPLVMAGVKLSWTPPTQYTDGQPLPLENIDSYRLVYDCGTPRILIISGALTQYTFSELVGTCTFSIATIDIHGNIGEQSNPVTIMISTPSAPELKYIPEHIEVCLADPNCTVLLTSEWNGP